MNYKFSFSPHTSGMDTTCFLDL